MKLLQVQPVGTNYLKALSPVFVNGYYRFTQSEKEFMPVLETYTNEISIHGSAGIYDGYGITNPLKPNQCKISWVITAETLTNYTGQPQYIDFTVDKQSQLIKQAFRDLKYLFVDYSGIICHQYFKANSISIKPRSGFNKEIADVEVSGTLWPGWLSDTKEYNSGAISSGAIITIPALGNAVTSQGLSFKFTPVTIPTAHLSVLNLAEYPLFPPNTILTTYNRLPAYSGSFSDYLEFNCESGEVYLQGSPLRKAVLTNYNNLAKIKPTSFTEYLITFSGWTDLNVQVKYSDFYL